MTLCKLSELTGSFSKLHVTGDGKCKTSRSRRIRQSTHHYLRTTIAAGAELSFERPPAGTMSASAFTAVSNMIRLGTDTPREALHKLRGRRPQNSVVKLNMLPSSILGHNWTSHSNKAKSRAINANQ